MHGRVHSREFKLTICRQIESGGMRASQICREHSLDTSLVSNWRREFRAYGENAFQPRQTGDATPTEALERRIAELERHCGQLSLENALLKKLASASPSRSATK